MPLSKYINEIQKTGFILEHETATKLKKQGWQVINNKYYIDDVENKVREIDLIAYKVSNVQGVNVFTSMIISCKKNTKNIWALLSRKIDQKDPNKIWNPQHVWSNDKILSFQSSRKSFESDYLNFRKKYGKEIQALSEPEVDIFAFQEMSKESGAIGNDKNIYNSVVSLMKAQSYELGLLPSRKKDKCIYHFSLLSIIDADLIRIEFNDGQGLAKNVASDNYVANYIINRKEDASKIRFIQSFYFEKHIEDYNRLHDYNCIFFSKIYDDFYNEILSNYTRTKILIDDFIAAVSFRTRLIMDKMSWFFSSSNIPRIKNISMRKDNEKKQIIISSPELLEEHVDFLNGDEEIKNLYKKALMDIYRCKDDFIFINDFDDDIPF